MHSVATGGRRGGLCRRKRLSAAVFVAACLLVTTARTQERRSSTSTAPAKNPGAAARPARRPNAARPAVVLREEAADRSPSPFAAILDDSEEAATLLKRANEAAKREDWKLAIDSLQRIIDLPGDHVLRADEGSYEAARRYAQRRLAALPRAGLATYRLLYDGEAETRYRHAVEAHDESALREVVERFLPTSIGERAALTLADWWIDEGRPAAAAGLLRDVRDFRPEPGIAKEALEARLAIAMALSGQPRAAQAIADRWPTTQPADDAMGRRLSAIRHEIGKLPPLQTETIPNAWPLVMGTPSRNGLMPLVEPSLFDASPWRAALPREAQAPLSDVYEYQRKARALPVMKPVTDGHIVVVKSEGRLLALDADTFEPLWRSDVSLPVRGASPRRQVGFRPANEGGTAVFAHNARTASMLLDYVGAAVTLSDGMAITVAANADAVAMLGNAVLAQREPRAAFFGEQLFLANSLVAYDLETGRIRWRCRGPGRDDGTGSDPSAEPDSQGEASLKELQADAVEFLASPVPIRSGLLVPYRSGSDLFAGVLDPATGTVRRRVYLCGLGGGAVSAFEALHPCVADEVAYIPTGRGVLLALDTMTWSIRWAVRYEGQTSHPRSASGRDDIDAAAARASAEHWLCTPPIAAGGVVLLAPPDADFLYAFDRSRGRLLWRTPRGDHLYVLGADARSVWLVGPSVTRIDLETGRSAWTHPAGLPTGRGAISGDRLYLPTVERLIVLDATSGTRIAELDLPADNVPFGNLLCGNDSMYSCGLRELRRFPDMKRSYASAQSAHRKDPSNAAAAIRLASLEMLREQPSQALAALEHVRIDADGKRARDARRANQVAHIRVEAMLALAAAPGTDANKVDELLQAARQTARSASDSVRAGMAAAEQLRKSGRSAQAYRQYVEIALPPRTGRLADRAGGPGDSTLIRPAPGDILMESSPGVRRPARLVVADRLAAIEKELNPEEQRAITAWLQDMLDAAVHADGEADMPRIRFLAEAGLPGDIGARAALQLGIRAQREERNEEAEHWLRDVARRHSLPAQAAEATVRLASIYLAPDELHMPLSAQHELQRVEKEFADVPIPAAATAEPVRADAGGAPSPITAGRMITGRQAAEILRRRIDARILACHRAAAEPVRLGAPGPVAFLTAFPDCRPLSLRGPRPEPLAETLLLLNGWSEVRAHSTQDGRLLWPATLRLIDESAPPISQQATVQFFVAGGSAMPVVPRPFAVNDGQTVIVNSPRGLHAIGLATGLRLWSRPYLPAADATTASDAFLSADAGGLLSLDADGTLAMCRTIDGDSVSWQRDTAAFAGGDWAAVRLRGDYAVGVGRELSRVSVFRAGDGRHLGDMEFHQPAGKGDRRLSLAMFDEVVCGPAGPSEVAARELSAPGVERWRLRCDEDGQPLAVTGLFKPQADILGIGCERGIVKLVDPTNGTVLLSARTGMAGSAIFEGAVTDGVLCLYGATRGEKPSFRIAAVDARDGRRLWQRDPEPGEFWSQHQYAYPLDNSLLRASSNAIPVARLLRPADGNASPATPFDSPAARPAWIELSILDKRTGRPIGEPRRVQAPGPEALTLIHDVLIWPDRVVVVANTTYAAFRIDAAAATPSARATPPKPAVTASRQTGGM